MPKPRPDGGQGRSPATVFLTTSEGRNPDGAAAFVMLSGL
jgi:hypothetical protein